MCIRDRRWTDPWSILDPQSLMKRYLAYFQSLGGTLQSGDAATIEHVLEGEGWRIATPDGPLEGKEVVLALGPITGRVLAEKMLGERTVINIGPYRPERFIA